MSSGHFASQFGDIRITVRDGERVYRLKCPGCGLWAELDDDQLHGLVSVDHTDTGCGYHETHNFWESLAASPDAAAEEAR